MFDRRVDVGESGGQLVRIMTGELEGFLLGRGHTVAKG